MSGHGQDPVVARDGRPGSEVRLVDGEPVDQHIGIAAAERGIGIEHSDLVKAHLAAGVAGLETLHEPVQRGELGGGGEPDAQRAEDTGGVVAGLSECVVQCRQGRIERVTGTLAGREGTFVLQDAGTVEASIVSGDWFVVPGSGTGELTGLRGEGGFRANLGEGAQVHLDYWFE